MSGTGQRVVVTGGAGGIGAAVVARFVAAGARVMVCDVDASRAAALAESLGQPDQVGACELNATGVESVRNMVSTVAEAWGGADVLVNCVGIMGERPAPVSLIDDADWGRIIDTNLTGPFYCMKYCYDLLKVSHSPVIVNIASRMGLKASPTMPAYVASKHGLIGLTKAAALDLAPEGFRVNAVCPGPIATLMLESSPGLAAKISTSVPMERIGTPEEVAEAVFWLAAPESAFVTGTALSIDGGLSA
ncbi:SDR family NAD(P)-dependent oxidoreductase [Amycolatopsis pithecellobii]|nr:SDR family oxidoreductase [Amycolatopsis pithecellobii]